MNECYFVALRLFRGTYHDEPHYVQRAVRFVFDYQRPVHRISQMSAIEPGAADAACAALGLIWVSGEDLVLGSWISPHAPPVSLAFLRTMPRWVHRQSVGGRPLKRLTRKHVLGNSSVH